MGTWGRAVSARLCGWISCPMVSKMTCLGPYRLSHFLDLSAAHDCHELTTEFKWLTLGLFPVLDYSGLWSSVAPLLVRRTVLRKWAK